ncbi:CCA tRNA nucleotidyltransferase, mitochondrial [Mortierella sp. GBA43]|nr:CCA tRNA nucleotidyltransferase, mitochondrial [Mortierella sp. GBA43]
MVVHLSRAEDRICKLLDRVARNNGDRQGRPIRLRIAGGWVRDKLLGLSSSDIDIGVESMMGYDFANLVADHLERISPHRKTVSRIASRPSRAKHLETATMFILGMPIDFVNLRSEIYDDPDRFPREVVFGTPYEDAHHRDFTINTLFYNLHNKTIEDYTGKGLEDLRDGWIRTPLKAFDTFRQDPLRVLRGVRFAARFNFKMTEDVKRAILDPRIRESLMTSLSKERIRDELYKILDDDAGRSTAIRLLQELQLHEIVFAPPKISILVKGVSAIDGERRDLDEGFRLAWIMDWVVRINGKDLVKADDNGIVFHQEQDPGREQLLKQTRGLDMTSHLRAVIAIPQDDQVDTPAEEIDNAEGLARRYLTLSALLYPYQDMTATHDGEVLSVSSWIQKHTLKAQNNQVNVMTKIMSKMNDIQEAVDSLSQREDIDEKERRRKRVAISMLIRDIGGNKAATKTWTSKVWPSAFLFALGIELLPKYTLLRQGTLDEESRLVISRYNEFLSRTEHEIQTSFSLQPLVETAVLAKLLNRRLGPMIHRYRRMLMQWQLEHPEATRQECIDWILANPHKFRQHPSEDPEPDPNSPTQYEQTQPGQAGTPN